MLNRLRLTLLSDLLPPLPKKKTFRSDDSMEINKDLYLCCVVGRICPLPAIRREQKDSFSPSAK